MVSLRGLSLRRCLELTTPDRRLLVGAAVAQVVAAAALRAMPVQALRASAHRFRRLAQVLVVGSDERKAWAIEATGRRLGGLSTCLIRALVAELLLDSNHGPVSLTIGVKRTAGGAIEAHAWVARKNRVLIGTTADTYVPLVTWTGPPASTAVDSSVTAGTPTGNPCSRDARGEPSYRYCVYGIAVVSDIPLALPDYSYCALGQVEYRSAPASVFLTAMQGASFDPRSDSWYRFAFLQDGSTYVRWETVGEFLVAADGHRITCRPAEESSDESFQAYMLGQALSFALVKQGFEPLHATVVVVDDQAVAFLGGNAFGKSSLAACFLEAGYRLLTDDLLDPARIVRTKFSRILVRHASNCFPGLPAGFSARRETAST